MVKAVALTDSPSILPELFAVLLKFAAASLTVRSNTKDLRFRQKFSLFGEACMENVALTYQAWSLALIYGKEVASKGQYFWCNKDCHKEPLDTLLFIDPPIRPS